MKITKLKEKLISCATIVALVAGMYLLKIPCLFKAVFRIACPGCGMTRAYLSLLRADFEGAFSYHPMFWSVPLLFLFYLFDGKLFRKKWMNTLVVSLIFAGFFATWVIRFFI